MAASDEAVEHVIPLEPGLSFSEISQNQPFDAFDRLTLGQMSIVSKVREFPAFWLDRGSLPIAAQSPTAGS